MDVEFDPAKDAANLAKHGVSLAVAAELDLLFAQVDDRFSQETRYRGFGLFKGMPYALAFTVTSTGIRAIASGGRTSRSIFAMSKTEPDPKVLAWLQSQPAPDMDDADNPEWTPQDFARAKAVDDIPDIAAVTKRGRGPARQRKSPINIRLSPSVLDYYRSLGDRWQTKLNADLEALVEAKTRV